MQLNNSKIYFRTQIGTNYMTKYRMTNWCMPTECFTKIYLLEISKRRV